MRRNAFAERSAVDRPCRITDHWTPERKQRLRVLLRFRRFTVGQAAFLLGERRDAVIAVAEAERLIPRLADAAEAEEPVKKPSPPKVVHLKPLPLSPVAHKRGIRFDDILSAVAVHYGVTIEAIRSPSRRPHLALARQVVCYLAHAYADISSPEIGRRLGGRDRTTVLHGVRKIEGLIIDRMLTLPALPPPRVAAVRQEAKRTENPTGSEQEARSAQARQGSKHEAAE